MSTGVALIITIVVLVVFSGAGLIFWYAFRFEVTNFKLVNNIIYLKSSPDNSKQDKKSDPSIASTIKITTDKIDISGSSLKILHISDFHLRTDFKGKKLEKFIKILALDNYDFIFITGDMVEKNELQDELINTLKTLKAKYGIYAVFGAHDYYNKKPAEFIKNMFKKKESYSRENDSSGLKKKLESIGIHVLQNESISLKDIKGYDEIDIIGVDDPLINKMDLKKSLSGVFKDLSDMKILDVSRKNLSMDVLNNSKSREKDSISEKDELKSQENNYLEETEGIVKTLEYREEFSPSDIEYHELKEKNKLKIAMVHTPDSYALVNLAINGIDIVFAGHTHGGQVRAPGIGALISGCNLKARYAAGLFYFKNFVLQVSKGLGEGRFSRFRIYCDPEAIITELVKD
ncbi:MAG: metallophosphoesterase [Candidatus Humimicrobiaceae bacterium]